LYYFLLFSDNFIVHIVQVHCVDDIDVLHPVFEPQSIGQTLSPSAVNL
jgi:hypothetical protein